MPPHRKGRWIVGALILPDIMAGLSYAFNKKTENNIGIAKHTLIFILFLMILKGIFVIIELRTIDLVYLAMNHTIIYFILAYAPPYIFAWPFIYYYWKKLPDEVKEKGW